MTDRSRLASTYAKRGREQSDEDFWRNNTVIASDADHRAETSRSEVARGTPHGSRSATTSTDGRTPRLRPTNSRSIDRTGTARSRHHRAGHGVLDEARDDATTSIDLTDDTVRLTRRGRLEEV